MTNQLARARDVALWLSRHGDASMQHAALLILDAIHAPKTVTADMIVSRERLGLAGLAETTKRRDPARSGEDLRDRRSHESP